MLELGGLFGLFLIGLCLSLGLRDGPRQTAAARSAADDPLFRHSPAHTDADVTFRRPKASAIVVSDAADDVLFGAIDTEDFDSSDLSHIRDFVQGTDILELHYVHGDAPMELSLDPNRAGGTDVVLNGELVAIVDNVMLMGADVVIKPKFDPAVA